MDKLVKILTRKLEIITIFQNFYSWRSLPCAFLTDTYHSDTKHQYTDPQPHSSVHFAPRGRHTGVSDRVHVDTPGGQDTQQSDRCQVLQGKTHLQKIKNKIKIYLNHLLIKMYDIIKTI